MRGFEIQIDEPAEYGGSDTGPMPTEVFLASLGACFALAVAHAARKQDIELPDLTVRASGEYEGARFRRLRVEVHSSHPRDQLERFVERAVAYCYVSNTLLQTPEIQYVIADGPVNRTISPPQE
jgi:uncharacterized OsmC-like protein